MTALEPNEEAVRLHALHELRLLDTPPSESFDRITRMASQFFGLPVAAVSLTDSDRQWFKSRVGVDHWSIPRDKAPCAEVAESREVLVIEDFLKEPFYHDSLLAKNGVRFYAGAPLTTRDGFGLGSMCVLGTEPRQATPDEIAALKDLASMVMAQIELQHAFGRLDPISGLPNRVQFIEDIDDLARDHAGEKRFAVLFDLIPVDQLTQATRVMGSAFIETMVKEAARNLSMILGPERRAYHVGITQLACLGPLDVDEAAYRARLEDKAYELHMLAGENSIANPVIGVAPFVLGAAPHADALRLAQGAAFDARAAGSLFAFYSPNQDTAFQRSFTLFRDFEQAIKQPQAFRLAYQPRVDIASGRFIGVEALMRWTHPVLGPVSPAEFIPLIEQSTLANATTAWVLDTALAQLARWLEAGIDIRVSVNVSAANLRERDFATSVQHALVCHGITADRLELEITETAVMSDPAQALSQLSQLAAAGITLAIDDFGTGYSSLSYLQRLPVSVVKIDRSFITNLDSDRRRLSLVTMMIDMAKGLDLRVVAEGVETQQEVTCLRSTKCDEIQGYFYGRPMEADAFDKMLRV